MRLPREGVGANQKTAIQFLDYVLARLPFPVQTIQTDNGAEFQSAFHYHTQDKGVGDVYMRPRTPRLNGKVDRGHVESFRRGARTAAKKQLVYLMGAAVVGVGALPSPSQGLPKAPTNQPGRRFLAGLRDILRTRQRRR